MKITFENGLLVFLNDSLHWNNVTNMISVAKLNYKSIDFCFRIS